MADIPPRSRINERGFTMTHMKELLRKLKLPVSGAKAALLKRLNEYLHNLFVHRHEMVIIV